ncbi:hypothetical protein [Chlamydia pecorum]|uniref:hypothetical protein n=1 Tax=Chlamydia pecorum TaxID=85991 RepID=UPI0003D3EC91|nr:hypothetical protein [Chlamydia pecorum]ETF37411.1 hypothetical protein CpecS_0605 [Chlamydia pecorum VR629]
MSTPVPSYIAEMSKVEDLSPLNTKNPSPWETCKTYFIKRSLICIVLTILLALGSSALACYAVLNNNWYVLGISLSITISSILIALLLAFPIKNKIYGTTLLDEISQDIETVGVQTLQSFEAMLRQIHYTQLPELKQLHRSLLVKRQENVRKQHELKDLETSSSKELSPKEPLPKESSSKEPSSKELSPKESSPKKPSSKEPLPKEPSSKEPSKFSFRIPFKKSAELPPLPPESPPPESPFPETYNPIPPIPFGRTTFQTKSCLNNNNKQGDSSKSSDILSLFSDFNNEDDDDGVLSFDDDVFLEKELTPPSRNYQTFDYEDARYENPGFIGNMCKSISQWFKKSRKK